MKLGYELFVRREVCELLADLPGRESAAILHFLETLVENPFAKGEETGFDHHGRACEIKLLSRLALYFWADHSAKEIRVVELVDADEG